MIKAATAILFILMTFVHASPESEKAKNQKEIKKFFSELADVNLSNDVAVDIVTEKIKDVLLLDVQMGEITTADKLSLFISSNEYLSNAKYAPLYISEEAVAEQSMELANKLPSFEELQTKFNYLEGKPMEELMRKELIVEAKQAVDIFMGKIHLRLVNEMHDQLSDLHEGKKDLSSDFQYTLYNELAQNVLNSIKLAIYNSLSPMGDATEAIKEVKDYFVMEFNSFNRQMTQAAKQLTSLLIKPNEILRKINVYLVNSCIVDMGLTESVEEQQQIADKYHSRIQLLIEVLKNMSPRSEEPFVEPNEEVIEEIGDEIDLFFHYMASIKSKHEQSEIVQSNPVFEDFVSKIYHDLLGAMLPIRPQGKVQWNAYLTLTLAHKVYTQNPALVSAITSSFHDSPFNPVVSTDPTQDIAQKLRHIDYLLNLKDNLLSEEQFAALIHNYYGLTRIDVKRRVLLFQIKTMLMVKEIALKNEEQFFIKLYDNLLDFVAFTPEKDLDANAHESFDKYVDIMFLIANNEWFQVNYLLVKLLNLAHITKDSTYVTDFAKYGSDDRCTQRLINTLNSDSAFTQIVHHSYFAITENMKRPQSVQQIADLYSGNTYNANLFALINISYTSEKTKTELELSRANKINVQFVQTGNQGSSKGSSKKTPYSSEGDRKKQGSSPNKQALDNGVQYVKQNTDVPLKSEDLAVVDNLHKSPTTNINKMNGQFEIEDLDVNMPEIRSGERDNLVYEVVGELPIEHLQALKRADKVEDFVNNHSIVVTKDGVETTYVFVKVVRKESPCHPSKMGRC